MVIALDAGAHALTLCRQCARDLLAARAECRREIAEETRERQRAAAVARGNVRAPRAPRAPHVTPSTPATMIQARLFDAEGGAA